MLAWSLDQLAQLYMASYRHVVDWMFNLQVILERSGTLTIVTLLIHNRRLTFHFLRCSLLMLSNLFSFPVHNSWARVTSHFFPSILVSEFLINGGLKIHLTLELVFAGTQKRDWLWHLTLPSETLLHSLTRLLGFIADASACSAEVIVFCMQLNHGAPEPAFLLSGGVRDLQVAFSSRCCVVDV